MKTRRSITNTSIQAHKQKKKATIDSFHAVLNKTATATNCKTFQTQNIIKAEFVERCLKLTENYLHMLSHPGLAKIPYHIHSDILPGH